MVVGGFFFLLDILGPSSGDGVMIGTSMSTNVVLEFTCMKVLISAWLSLTLLALMSHPFFQLKTNFHN